MAHNVLQLNADFVLHKICDLGAVSGSATPNFLKVAVDKLLTYRTPKKIIDHIEEEKMKTIIGNPPYDVNRSEP